MNIEITIKAPEIVEALETIKMLVGAANRTEKSGNINLSEEKAAVAAEPIFSEDEKPVVDSKEKAEPEKQERQYTIDEITRAGSALLDMGKMSELMALLDSMGVKALTQLKPEQYGAVVDGLKALGATI